MRFIGSTQHVQALLKQRGGPLPAVDMLMKRAAILEQNCMRQATSAVRRGGSAPQPCACVVLLTACPDIGTPQADYVAKINQQLNKYSRGARAQAQRAAPAAPAPAPSAPAPTAVATAAATQIAPSVFWSEVCCEPCLRTKNGCVVDGCLGFVGQIVRLKGTWYKSVKSVFDSLPAGQADVAVLKMKLKKAVCCCALFS